MKEPVRAYSYLRMSTPEQLKGDSLRRQTQQSADYAAANGLHLVENFILQDIGLSGFRGENVAYGQLGGFLRAIEAGDVPKGSVLLVESLDRISRQEVTTAMTLLLKILNAGVTVVTLSDGQRYASGSTGFEQLIFSLAIMSRSYEESRTKSKRISEAWGNKRKNVASTKLTKMCPAWLTLSDDRTSFVVNTHRREIVERIFTMAANGHGSLSITRRLNQEKVTPFGSSRLWMESYVEKILKNRSVLGEYQAYSRSTGTRSPVGSPTADYYPQIIDETLFLEVQGARRARATQKGGRHGSHFRNLFSHLATCAECGGPMRIVNKGKGPNGGIYLCCANAVRGGCDASSWRYDHFEMTFLSYVTEVDLSSYLGATQRDASAEVTSALKAQNEQKVVLETKRQRLYSMLSDAELDLKELRDQLVKCERELTVCVDAIAKLKEAQVTLATRQLPTPAELADQIEALRGLAGDEAYDRRLRLSAHLRDLIASLTLAPGGRRTGSQQINIDNKQLGALVEFLDDREAANGYVHPSFTVKFKSGVVQNVIVDKSDPNAFMRTITISDSGVEIGGRGLRIGKI